MTRAQHITSGLLHAIGMGLSIVGLAVLVYLGSVQGTIWHVVSYAVFGASLILLYTASTVYHLLPLKEDTIFRRLDHMMIFVLIAGTYTPFTLVPLRGGWGWTLFGIIWGLALAGMVVKAVWMKAPRWLSTGIYLFMGWIVVIAAYPLVQRTPAISLAWLLAGGLFYTVGAVIYGTRKPDFRIPWFGFHEIWHLFVMAGSISHFWAVRYLVLAR